MDAKKLLPIGVLLVAVILLVFLVIVIFVPNLPGIDDNQVNQQSNPTPAPFTVPTDLVDINRTTVTLNNEGTVRIGFNSSTANYNSVRMTISFEGNDVLEIKDASGAGVGNFEVVEQQEQSVTFEIDRIDSTQNTVARISVEGISVGSTGINAQIHTLTGNDGTATNLNFSDGEVIVDQPRPNITIQPLSVTHTDMPETGKQVTVRQATLPESGFVVLYNRSGDGPLHDEIAHSSYLEPGVHTNITLSIDQMIRGDREVAARLHYDKNENQVWDGRLNDTKFPSYNRNVTAKNTTLSVRTVSHVDVVLTNLTNGLQKYRIGISVSSTNQTLVSEVTPHHMTGSNFGVIGGGSGSQRVRVQGLDINYQVESTSKNMTLFTVAFINGDQLDRNELGLRIFNLVDDDGNTIPTQNVTTDIHCSSPFDGPVAGQSQYEEPTDPDCDGLFEDVNGDGRLTEDDVQALALVQNKPLPDEQIDALDFTGNGTLDFADIERLKDEIQ